MSSFFRIYKLSIVQEESNKCKVCVWVWQWVSTNVYNTIMWTCAIIVLLCTMYVCACTSRLVCVWECGIVPNSLDRANKMCREIDHLWTWTLNKYLSLACIPLSLCTNFIHSSTPARPDTISRHSHFHFTDVVGMYVCASSKKKNSFFRL